MGDEVLTEQGVWSHSPTALARGRLWPLPEDLLPLCEAAGGPRKSVLPAENTVVAERVALSCLG